MSCCSTVNNTSTDQECADTALYSLQDLLYKKKWTSSAHHIHCRYMYVLVVQVVIGTETELLRAWRSYSDFSTLAETATALGARAVTDYWDKLDRAIGGRRTTDPARLRYEVRCLGHFLTTMLEELRGPNIGVSPSPSDIIVTVWL